MLLLPQLLLLLHVTLQVLGVTEAWVPWVVAGLPWRENGSWVYVAKPVIISVLLKPVKGGK